MSRSDLWLFSALACPQMQHYRCALLTSLKTEKGKIDWNITHVVIRLINLSSAEDNVFRCGLSWAELSFQIETNFTWSWNLVSYKKINNHMTNSLLFPPHWNLLFFCVFYRSHPIHPGRHLCDRSNSGRIQERLLGGKDSRKRTKQNQTVCTLCSDCLRWTIPAQCRDTLSRRQIHFTLCSWKWHLHAVQPLV